MAALAFALHVLGAVVWVGGMFAIYVCLRPALVTVEPPQRLRLMHVTFQKFFPWVWTAVLLLLVSGYSMVFIVFGGFAAVGLHVHLMQGIGWLMIALFVWLFHGPWLAFKRAVDAEDWPSAGNSLDRIRQIISVNLPLADRRSYRRQWALLGLSLSRIASLRSVKSGILHSQLSSRLFISFNHEDCAEIIYVGQGRTGNHLIAQHLEKTVRIVGRQVFLCVDAKLRRANECIGHHDGAGDFLGSIESGQARFSQRLQCAAFTVFQRFTIWAFGSAHLFSVS
jgi:uncharacterized membrane protein